MSSLIVLVGYSWIAIAIMVAGAAIERVRASADKEPIMTNDGNHPCMVGWVGVAILWPVFIWFTPFIAGYLLLERIARPRIDGGDND